MYDIYLIFLSNIAYYYDYNVLILQVEYQLIQSSVIKSTKKSCTAKEKVPSSVTRPSSSRKLNHSADPIQSETVERSSFGSRSKWLVDSMKLETLVCVSKSNRMHVFWEFQRLRLTTHKRGQCVILATFYIGIGLKMAKLLYLSTVLRSPDQILTPYVVIFLDPKWGKGCFTFFFVV